jgi:hypothetical protein
VERDRFTIFLNSSLQVLPETSLCSINIRVTIGPIPNVRYQCHFLPRIVHECPCLHFSIFLTLANGRTEQFDSLPAFSTLANGKTEQFDSLLAFPTLANGRTEQFDSLPALSTLANGRTEQFDSLPAFSTLANGRTEQFDSLPAF